MPQDANQHSDPVDAKPTYRFAGKVPAALAHLRNVCRWVGWKYMLKDGRWTKPPFDPRTGRKASVSKPSTWGTYDQVVAVIERYGFDGVGIVLRGHIRCRSRSLHHRLRQLHRGRGQGRGAG
jgi:hypothetical protein